MTNLGRGDSISYLGRWHVIKSVGFSTVTFDTGTVQIDVVRRLIENKECAVFRNDCNLKCKEVSI